MTPHLSAPGPRLDPAGVPDVTAAPAPAPATGPGLPAVRGPDVPRRRAVADAVVHATLLRQSGVITRAQAVAAGLSPDTVDRRLATRRWHPVHPRVYRDAAFDGSAEAAVRAAVLWAGPGAVLSGPAAAWWHGLLPRPPGVPAVTVPRRRCPRSRPDVTVRRRGLDRSDVRVVRGVAVVAAPLAALETAVATGPRGAAWLADLLGSGRVGWNVLCRTQARNIGAHGGATAGRALAVAARRVTLRGRRRLDGLLGSCGPPGWVRGWQVAGLTLGTALPWARVAVRVALPSPDPPDEPGWRRAVLRRQGWTLLELDPCDVLTTPGGALARIHAALPAAPPRTACSGLRSGPVAHG